MNTAINSLINTPANNQRLLFVISSLRFTLVLILLAIPWLSGCVGQQPTAYQQDIIALDKQIKRLTPLLTEAKGQRPQSLYIRLAELHHKKAMLTKKDQDYQNLEGMLNQMAQQENNSLALQYAQANFNATMHRFNAATTLLKTLPVQLRERPEVMALTLDISLQMGRYPQAKKQLQTLIKKFPRWDNLARLAYYELNTGQVTQARAHYQQAANALSAKQMYQYAWINLQAGLLELSQENYQQALTHYKIADQAYSGYWLIEEHIAEVLALSGEKQQAIKIYRKLITSNPNPELKMALAELIKAQDPESEVSAKETNQLRTAAIAEFSKRKQTYPEAAAGHFVELLLSLPQPHPDLLDSALLNHETRPNADSKALLARSYLKSGQQVKAQQLYSQILTTPWRNPRISQLAQELSQGE